MITIFENILSKKANHIEVSKALERIKAGKSKDLCEQIRSAKTKDEADAIKRKLPSVCFSGKFEERKDEKLIEHSGLMVLDFDNVIDIPTKFREVMKHDYVYAVWISPSGNGVKALVQIADGTKHREHFEAIREVFPDLDRSGINVSRVCYESYDPNLWINEACKPFTKTKSTERVIITESQRVGYDTFKNILSWLSKRGDAFVTGERNIFIFKLASACCRFGLHEQDTLHFANADFMANDNTFTNTECQRTIKSAYRANKTLFGTAAFEKDILVDRVTYKEIEVDAAIFDETIRPKDVIYGGDVKDKALDLFHNGYENLQGIGCDELDEFFKLKRCELTLLSGIGNYGKSQYMKWYMANHMVLYDRKFAIFAPEDNPAHEFYHDMTEILLRDDCTPRNPFKVDEQSYLAAYEFVSSHIFFIYPKDNSPTPAYIKERFLELIIKEKVDGCIIDPFNQMFNDYGSAGGRSDKYLESILGDFDRFAHINNVYFWIIAHPKSMQKDSSGNYPCPDVFDIADGAMWNNKMYNILIYHRPNHQQDPNNPYCELHVKKIKRQKIVGKKGTLSLEYLARWRRFLVSGRDVLAGNMTDRNIDFIKIPF